MIRLLYFAGTLLSGLSAITIVITVSVLPWILGGVVPLARFILLVGAVAAAIMSILANLLRWQLRSTMATVLVPILGTVLLAMFQLRPGTPDAADRLLSTVTPAVRGSLMAHSALPADTRSAAAMLLALALIAIVAFDQFRSSRIMKWSTCGLILNACVLTAVGLVQLFNEKTFFLNDKWSFGLRNTFATFVNPNNAAGWLCVVFSIASGFLIYQMSAPDDAILSSSRKRRKAGPSVVLEHVSRFIADLTVWQILGLCFVAFLGTGLFSTQSRGGILALVLSTALTVVCRSSVRRLPAAVLLLVASGLSIGVLLNWFDLDRGVVQEMGTLRDINEAAGSRPRHWFDSLHSLKDSMLFGAGLGSYRFASLPYQTQHTGLWFRFADNQFVDVAVEGGLTGLFLFLAIGICGISTGLMAGRTASAVRTGFADQIANSDFCEPRRLSGAIAVTVIAATLSQGISGFFDYGVGQPAAASLMMLVFASSAALVEGSAFRSASLLTVAFAPGKLAVCSTQLCVLVAAISFLPDQLAAARVDNQVVVSHKVLADPVTTPQLDLISSTRSVLEQRLKHRPDDAEGLEARRHLAVADFRWQVTLNAYGPSIRQDPGLSMIWRRMDLIGIADHLSLVRQKDPETGTSLQTELMVLLQQTKLEELCREEQELYPLAPAVSAVRAAIGVIRQDMTSFEASLSRAIFVEPADADLMFHLGLMALDVDRPEMAQRLWMRSLQLSSQFQPKIMNTALRYWGVAEVMEIFGPADYSDCMLAAQQVTDTNLRDLLWSRARDTWSAELADEQATLLRATQLVSEERVSEAVSLLQQFVKRPGDHISARCQLAGLLEKTGQYRDALEEWHRVRYRAPDRSEAEQAIDRLNNLR